jgi:hypothetical protein
MPFTKKPQIINVFWVSAQLRTTPRSNRGDQRETWVEVERADGTRQWVRPADLKRRYGITPRTFPMRPDKLLVELPVEQRPTINPARVQQMAVFVDAGDKYVDTSKFGRGIIEWLTSQGYLECDPKNPRKSKATSAGREWYASARG